MLAVAGSGAAAVVDMITPHIAGKVVLDTTNPIGRPPENGVLKYFTAQNDSSMEQLQKAAPKALREGVQLDQ